MLLETVTYSGFLQKHVMLEAKLIFIPIFSIGFYFFFYPPTNYPSLFKRIILLNNWACFPLSIFLMVFFTLLEYSRFPNYVFSTFHIHYASLFYIFSISGLTFLYFFPKDYLKTYKKQIIFFIPLVITAMAFMVRAWPNTPFFGLSGEDSLFENLQFVFFFSTALFLLGYGIGLIKSKQYLYALIFLFLFSLFFFVSGEEISWGQRIFGIKAPIYLQIHNAQKETTIHNLHGLQEHQYIFYLFFSGFLASAWILIKPLPSKVSLFLQKIIPSWYVSSFFLPIFIFYFSINILNYQFREWQEFSEMLLAAGLFISLYLLKIKPSFKHS
jgi:hypothetical protein